jgi:hypothetical protein
LWRNSWSLRDDGMACHLIDAIYDLLWSLYGNNRIWEKFVATLCDPIGWKAWRAHTKSVFFPHLYSLIVQYMPWYQCTICTHHPSFFFTALAGQQEGEEEEQLWEMYLFLSIGDCLYCSSSSLNLILHFAIGSSS